MREHLLLIAAAVELAAAAVGAKTENAKLTIAIALVGAALAAFDILFPKEEE